FATRRSGADYLAVLAAGGGIHATVRATRDASNDQLLTLLRRRIADAVELGTTTIEVKSGYGLEPDEELRQPRLLARAKAAAPIAGARPYLGRGDSRPRARGSSRRPPPRKCVLRGLRAAGCAPVHLRPGAGRARVGPQPRNLAARGNADCDRTWRHSLRAYAP